jgi:hypothetical protein
MLEIFGSSTTLFAEVFAGGTSFNAAGGAGGGAADTDDVELCVSVKFMELSCERRRSVSSFSCWVETGLGAEVPEGELKSASISLE